MNSASILELLVLVLGIAKKILDRMPSYAESKKEEFYFLTQRFEDEISKEYPDRDDSKCDIYRRELLLFLRAFSDEISGADLASVHGPTVEGSGIKK